jgi:NAD(P)H dehydrogenase (quinone)
MSIIITGASGQLGRRTAELLLERAGGEPVVLVTRDPPRLADLAGEGVDIRGGDFSDPGSLASAFAGGERMLLISTDAVGVRVRHHQAAIEAAREAGIAFVAYTSVSNPVEENPAFVVPDHRATEEMLRESGLDWCFLRNNIYAEAQLDAAAAAIATGKMVTNSGDGRASFVAREDCAAAAAAVLAGGDHAGKAYDIAGPQPLDATALASIFREVGGRHIDVVNVDDQAFVELLAAAGTPKEVAEAFATFGQAIREGFMDVQSADIEALAGRPPRPLREVLDAHRDELRA